MLFRSAILLFVWWGSRTILRRPSPEARLVAAFMKRLRLYGIEVTADKGLWELTSGMTSSDVARFVDIYNGALYRDRRLLPEELRELRIIVKRLT